MDGSYKATKPSKLSKGSFVSLWTLEESKWFADFTCVWFLSLCYSANSPRTSYERALSSDDGDQFSRLAESLYTSLLRNSSSVLAGGGRIAADSFLSRNIVSSAYTCKC